MMIRVLLVLCLSTCLSAQEPPCLNPTGDYVLAKDIAQAVPSFAGVPGDTVLAPAPVIGGKRVFRTDELRLIADRSGAKVDARDDVCFAWQVAPLNPTTVLEALHRALNGPGGATGALIEVIEVTKDRAPVGHIEFPLIGLGAPASVDQSTPVVWRGDVVYANTRHFAIWARVHITAPVSVTLAAEKLEAGRPVVAAQLRTETRQQFPVLKSKTLTADQIVGMMPVRTLSSGAELRAEYFTWPNDVNRGDLVSIEARSGRVRLVFSGRAESAGRTGDWISVRNPDTQKVFQARVSAKNQAVVETGSVSR